MEATAEPIVLVGRSNETQALRQRLEGARGGRGSTVILAGPSGIGKSRLLQYAISEARESGLRVAAAVNFEHARTAFGPWADLLRELAAAFPEIVPRASGDRVVYDRLVGIATDADAGLDKRRAIAVAAEAIRRAAGHTPLALVLDDIQWCDPESLDLLHLICGEIGHDKIALFLGQRIEANAPDALRDLKSLATVTTLPVGPLNDNALRALIAQTLSAKRSMPAPQVDEIARRSDGNAFFLVQLVRAALEGGSKALPSTVASAVAARVAHIPRHELRVLEAAATLGRTFTVDALSLVAEASPEHIVAALRTGRDGGFLEEHGGGETFSFVHEMLRAGIYEALLGLERATLHRRVVTYLEAQTDTPAALLAHHWFGAREPARAATYARRAGDDAVAVGAHASARGHYAFVLEHGVLSPAERAELEESVAHASDMLGDPEAAATHFARAADLQREGGAESEAYRLDLRFALVASLVGKNEEMIAACRRVLDAAPGDALAYGANAVLAMYHAYRSEADLAAPYLAAAAALQPPPSDWRMQLTLAWARVADCLSRDDARCIDEAREAVRLAESSGDSTLLARSLLNLSNVAQTLGLDREGLTALERGVAVADREGLASSAAYARCGIVEGLHDAGRLEEAYDVLLELTGRNIPAFAIRCFTAVHGLQLLADLDRNETLPRLRDPALLEEAFATGQHSYFAQLAAAHVYAAAVKGDAPETYAALVKRTLEAMTSGEYAAGALLTLARFAVDEELKRIEALRAPTPSGGKERVIALMLDAVLAQRRGEERETRHLASVAGDAAQRAELPLLHALALELQGKPSDALAVYRIAGALAHIRRIDAPITRSDLTRREEEVAGLAAQGLSNRDISDKLVLSERTVEHHLSAIYAKRGYRSRAELIAAYARDRATHQPRPG
jgi:DNA-binding CsgD family transcriptional regulator